MDAATSAGGYISCERAIVFHHVTVALAGLQPDAGLDAALGAGAPVLD